MKRISLAFSLIFVAVTTLQAQYSTGVTGMLNIPTAEFAEAGSVRLGANILPVSMVPNFKADYDYTYNYFATISFFSFLEVSYRATLLKSTFMAEEEAKFNQQDRTYSIRANVLRERKIRPAFAIGANDPFSDYGRNYYASYYGVMTKSFETRWGGLFTGSLGYTYKCLYDDSSVATWHSGVFGGVSYTPNFYKGLKVMAEYDSEGVNLGAAVLLWNHLSIHCFAGHMNSVSAGLRYEGILIH